MKISEQFTVNQCQWFINMLKENREDALGTADNERLFSKGADSKEASEMHLANAKENSDYADILERIINKLQKEVQNGTSSQKGDTL